METQQSVVETLVKNVDENRKLRRLFRYNAQMKHGVPDDPEPQQPITVTHNVTNTHTGSGNTSSSDEYQVKPAPTPPVKDRGLLDPKNLLTAGAIALGASGLGLGGAYVANKFMGDDSAVISDEDSLYQELEDAGEHLP